MEIAVIGAVVALVIVAALGAWWWSQSRRTHQLKDQFGPEYERALTESGSRREAESDLQQRRQRVEQLSIVPLAPADREAFADRWMQVQANFVDDPANALGEADNLIRQVLVKRGYPMGDFENRSADISVDHPEVVSEYRAGHEIALANERGDAGTEDLRTGFVHYRALFQELLEAAPESDATGPRQGRLDARRNSEAKV
jgi:hypothetical protein